MNLRATKLLLLFVLVALPANVIAQSKAAYPKSKVMTNANLTDQEKMGKHLFLQHCALCHLPTYGKDSPEAEQPIGPPLELKGALPEKEKSFREHILKGSSRMPGFQYGLDSKDRDALIAYLKTL